MSDIFDMEQQILDCWHIIDDLKILEEGILDKGISVDDTVNISIGLEKLYQLKFEKLFNTYEDHCKEFHKYRKFYELHQSDGK